MHGILLVFAGICRNFAYFSDLPTQQAVGKLPNEPLLAEVFTCQAKCQLSLPGVAPHSWLVAYLNLN